MSSCQIRDDLFTVAHTLEDINYYLITDYIKATKLMIETAPARERVKKWFIDFFDDEFVDMSARIYSLREVSISGKSAASGMKFEFLVDTIHEKIRVLVNDN